MTVSTTTDKIRYSGTGSQYVFPYTFKIFADADLAVILTSAAGVDTTLTLTTHYTVSGAGSGSGGNVTMITAPGASEYLTVKRDLDILQETDYVENDPFPAASHENALDRLTMICQQINEAVDRALKISVGSGLSDITFPPLVANEYVIVNAAGDGLETTALLATLGSEAAAVALCVQLTGAQTVAGVKTFTSFPVTPSSAPTTNYQVSNKKYVDDSVTGSAVAAASQAEMEAATEAAKYVAPSTTKYHPGVAKAWVTFNVSGGAPVVDASYNLHATPITDNGTGDFTINFNVAFSNANYAWASGFYYHYGTQLMQIALNPVRSKTVSAFPFLTYNSADTPADPLETTQMSIIFYGDQ